MTEVDDYLEVKKCLDGDSNAFENLIDKYQKAVFNAALRMVRDLDDAEDITQAVFLKAYEKLRTFNPKFKFYSWIYRIAINESLNFIEKHKNFEGLDAAMTSKEKTPEEHYEDIELSEKIQDALMGLNIHYRAVIILRHFEQLSYKEMSYVLDLPEKTVKSRLFTARQLLSEILMNKGIAANAR
ncbi:MAG: RNA polymerase sigma factor [bacterium]